VVESHQHVIDTNVSADTPDIYADREKIIQVVMNLLSNAIKYTPEGGKILVLAEKKGEEVLISVADNGYGIPQEAHDKVFEKFFQADSITSQRVGGSGLGLTIARSIVEEHGGSIHFESPVPEGRFPGLPLGGERKGTVFMVHLPIKKEKEL
jgi:two-component system sensor histidine kinase VicK